MKKTVLGVSLAVLCAAAVGGAPTPAPQINAVVNAATFTPAVAPGGLVSIFGTDLAAQQSQAQALPLPTQLSGVSVTLNGNPVPLLYASATQINAQLPFGVTGNSTLRVTTPSGSSETTVTISDVAPAVFSVSIGQVWVAAATHANGAVVSPGAPAQAGEFISVYLTGLGQASGPISAGQAAPSSPPLVTSAPVQVGIGDGAPLTPSFAGFAPGFAGLYQVNVQVPHVATGTYALRVMAGGIAGNPVALTVSSDIPLQLPPTLVLIAATPVNASMMAGSTGQFTATGTMSDGTTRDLTSTVAWSSSAASVATINGAGLATAAGAGYITITAASGPISGSATLAVRPAPALVSIAVTPASPSIAAGSTGQFTATGAMSDGTTRDLTATATWSSSATSVATINGTGLASAMGAGSTAITASSGTISGATTLTVPDAVHHYEYVFPDGNMYVYDMDNGFKLVKQISIPQAQPVRGVAASPLTHTLYLSYGGDGPGNGNGSMLAYDLLTDHVMWAVNYPTGVDSMAVTPDGKTIYMPTGELSPGATWDVIDASNGNVTGTIEAGAGPHNTIVSLDGTRVYMAPRHSYYLFVAGTATNAVIRGVGPLIDTVRPFTINGKQTLAFTTATNYLGFQVSDINTGQVLYTVPIAGFGVPSSFALTTPSHGISLSPDEKEIWVLDTANSYVHVFDVSGLPGSGPKQVADLPTRSMASNVSPCNYDCERYGWVQHSRDGRYVFIGNSGDVFSTATRQSVINLDPLYNSRVHIEIDWQGGVPVATTTRHGVGHVTQ